MSIVEQFAHLCVWAGTDNYRWKMKQVGWTGWSVDGLKEKPAAEEGYEKE
ncbi:hypothetical protein [Xanthomonas phage X1]|nr:hypothetical protein [Xanthomonas phage X1]